MITGCVQQFGPQGFNIGRNAWLQEGLPIETPATTIDRQCGSAQQAVNFAAALIASGIHDCVIGSGVEHMGRVPLAAAAGDRASATGRPSRPSSSREHDIVGQGLGAEMIAEEYEIPRSRARRAGRSLPPLAHEATRPDSSSARSCRSRSTAPRTSPTRASGRGTDIEALAAAQAGLQAGRADHGRHRVADLRRRGRRAADVAREGRGARPHAARADRRPHDRRLRPGEDARGPDPGDGQAARAQRDVDRRHRRTSRSTRRSPRSSPPGRACTGPTSTASTRAAARWRSATRSARPAPA